MQCPRKVCAMCGHAHIGECRQGTKAYFCCGKSGHMVKDFPQNGGWLEVILSLGLIHRVKELPSLLRGIGSTP